LEAYHTTLAEKPPAKDFGVLFVSLDSWFEFSILGVEIAGGGDVVDSGVVEVGGGGGGVC